jgi:hypothetical protein
MYGGHLRFTQPKDYGINGFLPKGTFQLFRFLLAFSIDHLDRLLSFYRFFFWKNMREARWKTLQACTRN